MKEKEFFIKARNALSEAINAEKKMIDFPSKLTAFVNIALTQPNLMNLFYYAEASDKEFAQIKHLMGIAEKFISSPKFKDLLLTMGICNEPEIFEEPLEDDFPEPSGVTNKPVSNVQQDSDFDTCLDLAVIMKGLFGDDD